MKTKFFIHYGELRRCLDKIEFDLNSFEESHNVSTTETDIVKGVNDSDYYVVVTVRYSVGLQPA